MRLGLIALLVGLAPVATPDAHAAQTEVTCTSTSMTNDGIGLTSSLGLAAGRYALPATSAPTQLVVMFHGHGDDTCSWRNHLQRAAARGAVAVAMDNTGQRQTPVRNYGWFVRAGAADSIAAARHFMATYPSITQVFAMGVSMGGNTSGVAVASPDAVRADGSPLFDYWVDAEGVNNLTEEYLVARAFAPQNSTAALAVTEIEEENGGPLEAVPARYAEITNVARAADMAGLDGAVVVNGPDDGLVTTDQSPQMAAALLAVGVPTRLVTVVGRGTGESGTTASAIAADPLFSAAGLPKYQSPFAGHGWEGSDTHLVIVTAFEHLYALMDGARLDPGYEVVPGV